MRVSLKRQHGFLVIVAALMIVVIGFIGMAVTFMFVSSASSTVSFMQTAQALYLAESGFQQAIHGLLTPTLSNRIACSGLSLNNTLGAGAYQVTSTGPFYLSSATALTSALTSTATTIAVTTTSGYQSSGRIMIDSELINYASVTATNFIGVTRGVDGSHTSTHAAGTLIGQYQCNLSSLGGVPILNLSGQSGGKEALSESVQLPEGWAVGNNLTGPAWNAVQWNTPTELQWTQQTVSIATPQILNGVSIVSDVDVWIVGNKAAALHYNGNTWSKINTGIAGGDNLTAISAISSLEAWASATQGKVYKWSGGTWTKAASPGNVLNSISMIDSNGDGTASLGWVVGTKKTAFLYNGTSWSSLNTGITVDLNGVVTLSATDAWSAGNSGKIFNWTGGASWTSSPTPTTNTLNGISMIQSGSSDLGWAVGNSSTALYYNGSSWVATNTGLPSALTLNCVVTISNNEAWAADSNGHIYEWNGSLWTLVFSSAASINALYIVHPNRQPSSAWTENFS